MNQTSRRCACVCPRCGQPEGEELGQETGCRSGEHTVCWACRGRQRSVQPAEEEVVAEAMCVSGQSRTERRTEDAARDRSRTDKRKPFIDPVTYRSASSAEGDAGSSE